MFGCFFECVFVCVFRSQACVHVCVRAYAREGHRGTDGYLGILIWRLPVSKKSNQSDVASESLIVKAVSFGPAVSKH